jgi:CheY-like chemotaxis protein
MKDKLKNILLIDDDMTVNFLHTFMIESEEVTSSLQVAETAEAALAILSSERPDLILLDLNMPKTDGWQFLAQYRKLVPSTHRSPIIILSASADPDDKLLAERSPDVSGFYNKPLTKETLVRIIRDTQKLLRKK